MTFIKFLFLILGFSCLISCTTTKKVNSEDDLLTFAKSNCFFWYFKSQNINTDEIKKITSGIVSASMYSPDKFQKVAFLVNDYSPIVSTKNSVDNKLSRCFVLGDDDKFVAKILAVSEL